MAKGLPKTKNTHAIQILSKLFTRDFDSHQTNVVLLIFCLKPNQKDDRLFAQANKNEDILRP